MEYVRKIFSRRRELENPIRPPTEEKTIGRGSTPSSGDHNLSQVFLPEDDLECAICQDSIPIGTVIDELPCTHIYHPSCISSWLNIQRTCPMCRFVIPTSESPNRKSTANGSTSGQQENMDDERIGKLEMWILLAVAAFIVIII